MSDIVLYRVGFSCEKRRELIATEEIALARCDELMQRILDSVSAVSYTAYLTGGENYRLMYNPLYKANRDGADKPHYYQLLRDYLVNEWKAIITDGIEADDALAIDQMAEDNTVVCSTDKDLLQIPGHHYNFVRDEYTFVTPDEGLKNFYKQFLLGDTVDNIEGIYGYGPVKAGRVVNPCDSELEMFESVQSIYYDDARMLMNGRCLWLQRYPGQIWQFPEGAQPIDQEETDEGEEQSIYLSIQK